MFVGTCPYYLYAKGNILFCECATLRYPDKKSMSNHMGCYCCSETNGYEKCTMHDVFDDYYERLYSGEEIEPIAPVVEKKTGKRGRRPKFEGGM